jgi:hypothetical protein
MGNEPCASEISIGAQAPSPRAARQTLAQRASLHLRMPGIDWRRHVGMVDRKGAFGHRQLAEDNRPGALEPSATVQV